MTRPFFPAAIGPALALAFTLGAVPATAQDDAPMVERHTGATPGLILQSVTVNEGAEILYLSGQLASPVDPDATAAKAPGEVTPADYGDTRTQTISTLTKIESILAEHGYAMSDVFKMTAFLAAPPGAERMDFAGFNEGFRQFFGSETNPSTVARSTVQVAALAAPQFLIEIEVTAAK